VTLNNKIRVTNFAAVNSANFPARYSTTLPTIWTTNGSYSLRYLAYNEGVFIGTGYSSPGSLNKIIRSTDFQTFTEITVPTNINNNNNANLYFQSIAYSNGTWLILGQLGGASTTVIKSTDAGLTWSIAGAITAGTIGCIAGLGGTSNTFMVHNNSGSTSCYLTTNAGTSWSTVTNDSLGFAQFLYCDDRWVSIDISGNSKYSTNNGSTWSSQFNSRLPTGSGISSYYYIDGIILAIGNIPGGSYICISVDKGQIFTPIKKVLGGSGYFIKIGEKYYCNAGSYLYSSSDMRSWELINDLTGDSNVVNSSTDSFVSYYALFTASSNFSGLTYIPLVQHIPNQPTMYTSKGTTTINNSNSSYIDVTASKGSLSKTIRVPVVKSAYSAEINSMSVYPSSYTLASTVDGVVAADAFTNANITVTCYTNGIDTTSSWTISKVDSTGLSTTLTGSNIKINSLATATEAATCTITAANNTTGKVLTNTITVTKNKDDTYSGINRGASFTAYSTTQTAVYLKFLTTGYFQIKYGAGAYANAGQWYTPINVASPAGGSYYMIMEYTSFTGDTLNAGTGGVVGGTTWNQMNIDREYHLTSAVSGRHVIELNPRFATSNTGANANVGNGTLELNVP
jgi:hypothetical protein